MTEPFVPLSPDPTFDRQLAEIFLRIRQGQYDEAAARITTLKEAYPEHPAVLEIDGDLAFARGRFKVAEQLYRRAFELDRSNTKIEEKFATALLKALEPTMALQLPPDDDDSIWTNRVKRPVWASTLLSAIVPGMGQWYNGELIKGAVIFCLQLLLFFTQVAAGFSYLADLKKTSGAFDMGTFIGSFFTGSSLVVTLMMALFLLYSVIDAAYIASRTE